MNDRPDYVSENWLRCLGLSGKAAKAVMDVHTDQLNAQREALRLEALRINTLEETVRECPDFEISHNGDHDEGAVGFIIELGGCDPATFVDPSLRGCLDRLVAAVHHNPTGKC